MLIAIPSKGRPNTCRSQKLLPTARVFVPACEIDAYRSCGVTNLVAVPDSVRGITRTRNWILEYAKDDPWVVMVDDDYRRVAWVHLLSHSCKHIDLTEKELMAEFVRLFELTEQLGYRVWGPATDGAPRSVYPWKPFYWQSYITASCIGIINRGIRFDESFPVKEDYELCLRCIKEDGGVVAARHWYWVNSHWIDDGGCKSYRTQQMEREAIAGLMRLYPGMIRRITRGGSSFSIELDF